ncbi:hypothetical protein LAZ67_16002506 [Cordylochernes scorpioides]|uniref:Transposase n=1 Tax=Cordylochernes scorpioides TaxID=51811 RepID=A0ABY6LG86_9ARAC|nr:hypothetical protein LAZ67_16002506 [Cordylochernes scorpioides]
MVRRWRSWLLEGRQNVHDVERSGRPVISKDNAAVAAVRNVVEADRRVTIDEIMIRLPPGIEIGHSSIRTIMADVLNFRKLRAAIKRKGPGLLSRKVLLVHDNARPYATRTTRTWLENLKWEIFTHPPYSPDLAPSDFHLFPALKLHFGGKHFANDDEMQAEAYHWQ